ncbi:uncharacterized protein PGTG_04441 [Puccinia graminis f. sp. tritici CRL 75-36-700-3]|uniref:DDE Tnp4 domain-containing protein n=1 Tax=Puccinia graminis f. sp. tritici (strain CRL 75-36-700-3 / race SCCL) TaxID=418459 RepID=E3K2B6_PUCGT|nr:uncharacterized protein PGTG_04441 [Puccinia graminis f. sp. tritici CRL 75-36-700-3]EFP78485.2 hypothetical protein PGTG_04441 [Puccinia graminis f. sp. tritici CRL 75-36-700-3]
MSMTCETNHIRGVHDSFSPEKFYRPTRTVAHAAQPKILESVYHTSIYAPGKLSNGNALVFNPHRQPLEIDLQDSSRHSSIKRCSTYTNNPRTFSRQPLIIHTGIPPSKGVRPLDPEVPTQLTYRILPGIPPSEVQLANFNLSLLMHKNSERQQILRDLFMILVFLHEQQTDDLIDSTLGIPTVPSLGRILAPTNPGRALVLDIIFDDEAMISNMFELVLRNRYLNDRLPARTRDEFDLAQLFNMRDEDFKQAVRTTKAGFMWLLGRIMFNSVFHSASFRPQLPVPHQLALTLERLGSNGNGASVGRFSRNLGVGRGTVIKASRRVIQAINELSHTYLLWPDEDRRKEISEVMKAEGFEGCIGFVDGTTIPLYQRPSIDGEVFFDRKKRYSINCQVICDCDRFITGYMTGWPGSCGDSMVFKKMAVHRDPGRFFDPGQYLIADSAYELGLHCIPAYKAPAAYILENTEFNYCLARSRVRNEHTIGILKGRWASLQHLRLAIQKPSDMMEIIRWVNCCVTLHNMLAHLGDAWDLLDSSIDEAGPGRDVSHEETARGFRDSVQVKCLDLNHSLGVLPI